MPRPGSTSAGPRVPRGSVALVSQSGNLLLDFNQHARERGLGFSRQVTIGNAADIGAAELIESFLANPDTEVVLAYLEGWEPDQGRGFVDVVRYAASAKPVVLLKPGRSEAGRRAVLSHTGTLAGEERIVDAALRQGGILRAGSIEEAWDLAAGLCRASRPMGAQVAVISDGGGHSSVLSDALGLAGLEVPDFDEGTRAALATLLPPRATIRNPIDFAGVVETDPEALAQTIEICARAPDIDAMVVAGHFGGYHKIGGVALAPREVASARRIVAQDLGHRLLVVHSIYANERLPALEVLREAGIPVLRSPESAARLVAGLHAAGRAARRRGVEFERRSNVDRATVERLLAAAIGGDPPVLLEPEARSLVAAFGIPVPAFAAVDSPEECAAAVAAVGTAALKLIAPGVLHRTELGGIRLGVNEADAAAQFRALVTGRPATRHGEARVMVTSMIEPGIELILGGFRDPQFGPVVMFGLGGIAAEALDDVAFRLAPLGIEEARESMNDIRARSLVDGFRGAPPVERVAVSDILVRLGEILCDVPEIREIDLNPVIANATGIHIADARVVLVA